MPRMLTFCLPASAFTTSVAMSGHPQGGHYEDGYAHQGQDAYYDDHQQGYYDTGDYHNGQQAHDGYYDEKYVAQTASGSQKLTS